jgi:peptide/nickel transport system permease protein
MDLRRHEKASSFLKILSMPFSNKKFVVGFMILAGITLTAVIGDMLLTFDPLRTGRFPLSQPPSLAHLLGTDTLGRDLFAQLLLGIESSLTIGLIVATVSTLLGATMGFIAGYYKGFVDLLIRSVTDTFIVLPLLPILILISCLLRTISIFVMAAILCIFSWAWTARQVRSQTLSVKESDFVYMSKLSGMKGREIIFTEIMPHMLQWMIANFINVALWAMIIEAGLEMLGLGPHNTMTLGMMLYWANLHSAMFREMWWWWAPPVIVLVLIFVSLYTISIGLDETINPRQRTR